MKSLDEINYEPKALPLSLPAELDKSSWRDSMPKVDAKKAKDPYSGTIMCPEAAIMVEKGKMIIVSDACTGCLICLRETPYTAISEEKVEK